MRLTARAEYAYWAMVELAEQYRSGQPVGIPEIARRRDIPPKFLLQVMTALKHGNLVESVRGRLGGFRLRRPPGDITVLDIYEATEGSDENVGCPTQLHSCRTTPERCPLARTWRRAVGEARALLAGVTLREAAEAEQPPAPTYHI